MTLANGETLRLLAFAALLGCGPAMVAPAQSFHAKDLQGRQVERLDTSGAKVVVLIFAATDCPISNRYIPEIARLQKEFGTQRVAFWWVFPNPEDTSAVVRKHESDYSMQAATIIDANQELVRMAHVSVTPEAAVFAVENGALREAYRGRIDDLYFAFGKERPVAAHRDLEGAIQAVLAGKPTTGAAHGPVGCSIIPLTTAGSVKR